MQNNKYLVRASTPREPDVFNTIDFLEEFKKTRTKDPLEDLHCMYCFEKPEEAMPIALEVFEMQGYLVVDKQEMELKDVKLCRFHLTPKAVEQ